MQLNDVAGQLATRPAPNATVAPGWTNNNPSGLAAATVVDADFLNAIGAEALTVLTATGQTMSKTNVTQIYLGILSAQKIADSGGTNALVAAPTMPSGISLPALSAIPDGLSLLIIPNDTTTIDNPTFAFNGGSAVTITDPLGHTLAIGAIVAGVPAELMKMGGASPTWWLRNSQKFNVGAGIFSGLVISNDGTSPNTKRDITANLLSLSDANGAVVELSSVGVSINSGTSGAGGLDTGTLAANQVYFEWVISQPGGASPTGLMSLSSSSPTMPSGYTMKVRVGGGAITDGSSHFYRITQKGKRAQYIVTPSTTTSAMPLLGNGVLGTWSESTPTWATLSTAAFVPSTASELIAVVGNCRNYVTNVAQGALAPNSNYGGNDASSNPPPIGVGNNGNQDDIKIAPLLLESSNVYAASNQAYFFVAVLGWNDNL